MTTESIQARARLGNTRQTVGIVALVVMLLVLALLVPIVSSTTYWMVVPEVVAVVVLLALVEGVVGQLGWTGGDRHRNRRTAVDVGLAQRKALADEILRDSTHYQLPGSRARNPFAECQCTAKDTLSVSLTPHRFALRLTGFAIIALGVTLGGLIAFLASDRLEIDSPGLRTAISTITMLPIGAFGYRVWQRAEDR